MRGVCKENEFCRCKACRVINGMPEPRKKVPVEVDPHECCKDEPCSDCIEDRADDFDRALDWARDHGEEGF